MQLVLISPLLYKIFTAHSALYKRVIILVLIYFLSLYLTEYTKVSEIFGGGDRIFGGTYLFAFAIGMFFYFYMDRIKKNIQIASLNVGAVLLVIYESIDQLALGWSNPPNDHTLVYLLFVVMILYGLYNIIPHFLKHFKIEVLGRYSLYIFLYEKINNPILKYFVLLLWSAMIPVAAIVLFRKVRNIILGDKGSPLN